MKYHEMTKNYFFVNLNVGCLSKKQQNFVLKV